MEHRVGKPKFKSAIFVSGLTIVWAVFLSIMSPYEGMKVFSIFLILVTLFVVLPGMSYCQLMWRVDEHVLQYTYHDHYYDKIISFYRHIFLNHRLEYQMTIYLSQIDYIVVTYAGIPRGPFGGVGYDILFEVHMLDGSLLTFESLVTMQRKRFIDAVAFMKEQGIVFEDKYHILLELKKDRPIAYYLEKMDKESKI